MGLDQAQLRNLIVKPPLDFMGLGGLSAENLIIGTGIIESRLTYIKQTPGPALSLWQIEPATYNDLRTRSCLKYPKIVSKMLQFLKMDMLPFKADYLAGNLYAAVMIARMKYYFDRDPLPAADDFEAMALYYKRIYNTYKGATDIKVASAIFRSVVMAYAYHG